MKSKKALEERGERVRILNPGGLWSDITGKSDSYNPLDIIVYDLERAGGLRDDFGLHDRRARRHHVVGRFVVNR